MRAVTAFRYRWDEWLDGNVYRRAVSIKESISAVEATANPYRVLGIREPSPREGG